MFIPLNLEAAKSIRFHSTPTTLQSLRTIEEEAFSATFPIKFSLPRLALCLILISLLVLLLNKWNVNLLRTMPQAALRRLTTKFFSLQLQTSSTAATSTTQKHLPFVSLDDAAHHQKTRPSFSLTNFPPTLSPSVAVIYPQHIDLDDPSPPIPSLDLPDLPHIRTSNITCYDANCSQHQKAYGAPSDSAGRLCQKTPSSADISHSASNERQFIAANLADIPFAPSNLKTYVKQDEDFEYLALGMIPSKPARRLALDDEILSMLATI